MTYKTTVVFFAAFLISTLFATLTDAQGVSINTSGAAADSSAMIDVASTTKGALIPRMSTLQRNAIIAPATGLIIFNTDCNEIQYYTGSAWISVLNSLSTLIPGPISGPSTFCAGQTGVSYSITSVSGATSYLWSVPPGSTINSGQGTNSIVVTFGSNSGIVSVSVTNGCNISPSSNLVVTGAILPLTPGAISGSANICSGQSALIYSVAPVPGTTTYNWSLPTGTTITAGSGTNSITVTAGNTSGTVSVTSTNSCGTSAASNLSISITSAPATPGSVSGPVNVTPGQTGLNYSIAAVSGATSYTWTAPTGSVITSGQGSTSITVTFGSTSGSICVTAGNICGNSTSSCLSVSTACYTPGSITLNYTGGMQTWTVPCGVTSIVVLADGARGGNGWNQDGGGTVKGYGGYGGRTQATLTVTPGSTLNIFIGGTGMDATPSAYGTGGYNGGGTGFRTMGYAGGGGGGATDIRLGGTALSDRILVAGGGGAGSGWCTAGTGGGGAGGGTTGGSGSMCSGYPVGTGGTQSGGGSLNGTLGTGGTATNYAGSGGGGGYYGGGASDGSGAGGGSNYVTPTGSSAITHTQGVQTGNGQVSITW